MKLNYNFKSPCGKDYIDHSTIYFWVLIITLTVTVTFSASMLLPFTPYVQCLKCILTSFAVTS